jgi:hypothetical protein
MAKPPSLSDQDASKLSQLDQIRFAPANRKRLSGPGLRTFLNIADRWSLTHDQRRLILGSPSQSTYTGWCGRARRKQPLMLSVDVLMRISAVLGIHQALGVLFPDEH